SQGREGRSDSIETGKPEGSSRGGRSASSSGDIGAGLGCYRTREYRFGSDSRSAGGRANTGTDNGNAYRRINHRRDSDGDPRLTTISSRRRWRGEQQKQRPIRRLPDLIFRKLSEAAKKRKSYGRYR